MSRVLSCVANVPVFQELGEEQLSFLTTALEHRSVRKGEVVVSPADDKRRLVVLAGGLLKVSVLSTSGREQILRIMRPGDFFGELSLFTGRPSSAQVVALEDSIVCQLASDDLRRVLDNTPKLSWALLKSLAERLERTEQLVENLGTQPVEARTAQFLLDLAQAKARLNPGSSVNVRLPMTRQQLASHLGCARETLSRTLSRFQAEGLIAVEGPRLLKVLDLDGLRARAGSAG